MPAGRASSYRSRWIGPGEGPACDESSSHVPGPGFSQVTAALSIMRHGATDVTGGPHPLLATVAGWPGSRDPDALRGKVALVAGATRGAGRGIAAALGEAGATVICTGRSSRTGALESDYVRSETIEETAELVTRLGGVGIAEVVDHLDPLQVAELARVVSARSTGVSTSW